MGAFGYNSVPFAVTEITVNDAGLRLTWNSQPNGTYVVWSCSDIAEGGWVQEATLSSLGDCSNWADRGAAITSKFYPIEMK